MTFPVTPGATRDGDASVIDQSSIEAGQRSVHHPPGYRPRGDLFLLDVEGSSALDFVAKQLGLNRVRSMIKSRGLGHNRGALNEAVAIASELAIARMSRATAVLVASLGNAGVLLVQRLAPGANAQLPSLLGEQTSLDEPVWSRALFVFRCEAGTWRRRCVRRRRMVKPTIRLSVAPVRKFGTTKLWNGPPLLPAL